MSDECTHTDTIREVTPSALGCEECLNSWIIESETQGLERYCVIPPHFRAAKFTEERPAYVLSSREIRRFGEAFWELAHRIGRFFREIEGWHLA